MYFVKVLKWCVLAFLVVVFGSCIVTTVNIPYELPDLPPDWRTSVPSPTTTDDVEGSTSPKEATQEAPDMPIIGIPMTPTPTPTPPIGKVLVYDLGHWGFDKLVQAAAEEGIEITTVFERSEFRQQLETALYDLVIYPCDFRSDRGDIGHIESSNAEALYIVDKPWTFGWDVFPNTYGVEFVDEAVINTSSETYEDGLLSLTETLPDFLSEYDVVTRGRTVMMRARLETDHEGETASTLSWFSKQERTVFFSEEDRSNTFMVRVKALNPDSDHWFDNEAIELGDNKEAAIELLKWLIEIEE